MKSPLLVILSILFAGSLIIQGCGGKEDTGAPESKAVGVYLTAMGMHCNSCEETIETTFAKMPGVDSVKADYVTKEVFVMVDTSQTSYSRLEELITELGFDTINDMEEM